MLNRKVQLAFGSAILILLVVGAVSYHDMNQTKTVLILGTIPALLMAAAAGGASDATALNANSPRRSGKAKKDTGCSSMESRTTPFL